MITDGEDWPIIAKFEEETTHDGYRFRLSGEGDSVYLTKEFEGQLNPSSDPSARTTLVFSQACSQASDQRQYVTYRTRDSEKRYCFGVLDADGWKKNLMSAVRFRKLPAAIESMLSTVVESMPSGIISLGVTLRSEDNARSRSTGA